MLKKEIKRTLKLAICKKIDIKEISRNTKPQHSRLRHKKHFGRGGRKTRIARWRDSHLLILIPALKVFLFFEQICKIQ